MATKQNVSADRFLGRCPTCNETTTMVRQRKLPRHPVTEWHGVCPNDHDVYVKTVANALLDGLDEMRIETETELLAAIGLMMYEMWLDEDAHAVGTDTEMDRVMRKLSELRGGVAADKARYDNPQSIT